MLTFEDAVKFTLEREGIFSDISVDPGGPTKYGITIKTLSRWLGKQATLSEIKNLTVEEAKKIYKAYYWNETDIEKLPSEIVVIIFDMAVNQGSSKAKILLQEVVGAKPDGIIGRHTLSAIKSYSGNLKKDLTLHRMIDYTKDRNFNRFAHSWFNRSLLALLYPQE